MSEKLKLKLIDFCRNYCSQYDVLRTRVIIARVWGVYVCVCVHCVCMPQVAAVPSHLQYNNIVSTKVQMVCCVLHPTSDIWHAGEYGWMKGGWERGHVLTINCVISFFDAVRKLFTAESIFRSNVAVFSFAVFNTIKICTIRCMGCYEWWGCSLKTIRMQ